MDGSKWIWLAKKCSRLGFKKSKILAQEIEEALVNIYGDGATSEWRFADKEDVDFLFKASREAFIMEIKYCPGCIETVVDCTKCRFGKEVGICSEENSLFSKFKHTFELEEREKKWKRNKK